ncbi:hypothetical protein IQ16_02896 [Bradyrhizobium huanghuaihaiense]|uniref:Uncharacterized protein n=1 Tax=Bradyrhizobium huanghuaihaiense TaxID=990078 RepID=A0A562RQ74_9BRAD|nr:hypothetical protein [Bradyrhizobium huanghuaihaiense]TWI71277.1 hypothetical protein IQ16_02896 [Bradyrhizobium huanghuaihaiense]
MDEEEQARKDLEEFKVVIGRTATKMTDRMHHAVGRSITEWSRMEGFIVHIASMLLDSRANKVGLVFYSINNVHTWLSIIDELFEMDTNFSPLRSDWNKIAARLRKLNDVRVRLAHHALEPGNALEILETITVENVNLETFEADFDAEQVFPSLKPHANDTRMKWKKKTISLDEIVTFLEQLHEVLEALTALLIRMKPIYLGPKQRLVAKIRELQQKVAQH